MPTNRDEFALPMPLKIHVLSRAVIRVNDRLMVARCVGAANTFLPGGHVEIGEGLVDALARELDEELGIRCQVGDYLGAIEHAFGHGDRRQHEINHLFRVELPGSAAASPIRSLEENLECWWQPVSQLDAVNLQPYPLVDLIRHQRAAPWWASTLQGQ